MSLCMRCCSSPAIPKVSSLGTHFFAHKSRAGCQTGPESPEHLQAKFIIAESAETAGWRASTEESGIDPDGNPWIADVICTQRNAKVAFEVQLVSQSLEVIRARQERYRRSDIRGLWLIKLRGRKFAGESALPCKDLPMVFLE
jgi:competence protein CoiA